MDPTPSSETSASSEGSGNPSETLEHEANIQSALKKIEQAQRLVADAARDLCPVQGFADQWCDICQLCDEIKQKWHAVDNRRHEIR